MSANLRSRLVKLEGHAAALLDVFINLKERYAMLDPMLFRADVAERFGKGRRKHGYLILRHSLFLSCCQDIAKVVMDDYDRTPSFKRLMVPLKEPYIAAELRHRYAAVQPAVIYPTPGQGLLDMMRLRDEQESHELGHQFDRHYADLCNTWDALASSSVIEGFVAIRNKASAHADLAFHDGAYSFFDISTAGITWADLRETIVVLQHGVELIGAVIRGAGFTWDRLDTQLDNAAREFWSLEA